MSPIVSEIEGRAKYDPPRSIKVRNGARSVRVKLIIASFRLLVLNALNIPSLSYCGIGIYF